ncbi:MAG: hypothetical protein IE909_09585 [Campylobacterales bacterium]|nr:hypothetical protein [Campylobacterota bacterium]MBD3842119.1 hypothetical protein [Campylobacterales bacterium]
MKLTPKTLPLFDVVDKMEQSTASITELRVPIFAPVQKLSGNSTTSKEFKKNGGIRIIKTGWGKVEIRGRILLTQVHRDLLDCIYTHATDIKRSDTGEVTILFSQSKILREYKSSKSDSWDNQTVWLRKKIKEIRDVTINYENNKGDAFDFNLISNLDYSEEHNSYLITLDKRYIKFYEKELSINYRQELPKLLKVESAIIKAIIRWFFTHKDESKYYLSTILEALGFPIDSPKTLQTTKKDLKENTGVFESFGIEYDPKEEIFFYRGNPNVGFIPSLFKNNSTLGNKKSPRKEIQLEDFIDESIYLKDQDQSVVIKSIDPIYEGVHLEQINISTQEGLDFSIHNANNLLENEFMTEVYIFLETLKRK